MKYALLLPMLTIAALYAQNDVQANVDLQFRFVNPGARAQAMGGAFVGLADDTTALFSNPAGLVQMRSATLGIEGNHTSHDNTIPFYAGTIEQNGLQDFDFRLQERDFKDSATSVPFLGYVSPKSRVKWGVFLAEQANYQRRFETEGVGIPYYRPGRYVSRFELEFFPPSTNYTDLTLRTIGVAVAGNLTPILSGGITLTFNEMDYRSGTELRVPNYELLFPDVTFSPSDLAAIRPLYGNTYADISMDGKDTAPAIYAGLLLHPNARFGLGIAYKQQPRFDYDYRVLAGDGASALELVEQGSARFNVPDSYAAGFSFKPSDVAILSVEVTRVLYSELSDDYLKVFDVEEDPIRATQSAPDITEYHVGFEYVFVDLAFPLSLRLGYFHEPYHALQNTVLDTQLLFRFLNENEVYRQGARATAFLHQFEKDLNHITVGLGWTFGNATLDIGADVDEENSSYSVSSFYRF